MDAQFFETLEQAILKAAESNDQRLMSSYLDDKFVGVGLLGTVFDRGEFLSRIGKTTVVHKNEVLKMRVISEKDMAVVVADWKVAMTHDGSIVDGLIRVSRTWVRRDHQWKILSFHISDARMGESWMLTQAGKRSRS